MGGAETLEEKATAQAGGGRSSPLGTRQTRETAAPLRSRDGARPSCAFQAAAPHGWPVSTGWSLGPCPGKAGSENNPGGAGGAQGRGGRAPPQERLPGEAWASLVGALQAQGFPGLLRKLEHVPLGLSPTSCSWASGTRPLDPQQGPPPP